MATLQQQTQISELYTAVFNRAPDATGAAFWLEQLDSGKMTMTQIATDWMTKQAETALKYPTGMSTSDFVEAIYNNVLGRSSDTEGKAFWVNAIDSGNAKKESFIQNIIDAAHANGSNDGLYLTNRASVGIEFVNSGNNDGTQAINILKVVTADAASVTTAKALINSATIDGTVMDGYISGARVFLDGNFNGRLDAGEISTTTDASGQFTLRGGIGQLVASGGTDVTTNAASKAIFTSAMGSTIISPISTLIAQKVADGSNVAAAQTAIKSALGITSNIDLATTNPLTIMSSSTATDAQKAEALKLQAANVQVNNILSNAVSALTGAGETLNDTKMAAAMSSAATTIAAQFSAAATAGTTVNLSSASLINSVLAGVASTASSSTIMTAMNTNTQSIANMLAENNGKIDAQVSSATPSTLNASLGQIGRIQEVVQDTLGTAIAGGTTSMATITSSFTGSTADTLITNATIGGIDPGIVISTTPVVPTTPITPTTPTTSTTPPSGDSGTADTTAPNAPMSLALEVADDIGFLDTDGITSQTSGLTITGSAEAGSTVKIYDTDGTTLLGSGTATGGAFSIDVSLAAGTHTLAAKATDTANNTSVASSVLSLVVDTTAPTVTNASPIDAAHVGVILSETGYVGLRKADDSLIMNIGAVVNAAGQGKTLGVEAQSSVTVVRSTGFDTAGNTAESSFHLILGTTDADNIAATTYGETMYGFGGADVFDIPTNVSVGQQINLNAIGDYTADVGGDKLLFGGTVSAWTTPVAGWTISNGVVTKTDATANDFLEAFRAVGANAGEVAAFEYAGSTYVFAEGATNGHDDNHAVWLNGVTGITGVSTGAATNTIWIGTTSSTVPAIADVVAPDAPAALNLAASDDTGSSTSDNITKNATGLTFDGTGENGATVTLFADADNDGVMDSGESLGTATVAGGVWTIDNITLTEGVYHINAFQTDAANNASAISVDLDVVVDTTPITLQTAGFHPSNSNVMTVFAGSGRVVIKQTVPSIYVDKTEGYIYHITLAEQTTLSAHTISAYDIAGNESVYVGKVILGTSSNESLDATTNYDLMEGFGGADTFTLLAGGDYSFGKHNTIMDYTFNLTDEKIVTGGTAAVWATAVDGWTINSGVATKTGADASAFYDAFKSATGAVGEVVVFDYSGGIYLFGEGATTADDDNTVGVTAVSTSNIGAHTIFIA